MDKCNCHSYNLGDGEIKEIVLKNLVSILPDGTKKYKDVYIDACIADTIKYLWDNNVATLSSCCGHNKLTPHIVFANIEDAVEGKKLLKKIDNRIFELSYWSKVLI